MGAVIGDNPARPVVAPRLRGIDPSQRILRPAHDRISDIHMDDGDPAVLKAFEDAGGVRVVVGEATIRKILRCRARAI